MKTRKTILLVFLILLSFCVVNTRPVKSQFSGIIYIRSDGSVEPVAAPIRRDGDVRRSGNVYTLTGNVTGSIVVERENIVVDGAGYVLEGTHSGTGINVASNIGNVTIKNMQIRYFIWGIELYSNNCTVSENNIMNCNAGVQVMSSNNKIIGNYLTAMGTGGVVIQGSENSIICRNTVIGNKYGIEIIATKYTNIILGNNISRNSYGIYFLQAASQVVYHNNFINNTNQVWDHALIPLSFTPLSVHIWDNGGEGNYWSDYTGIDANGDGIGDTPYHINSQSNKSNDDFYPLMKPVDISAVEVPAWFPDTTPPTVSIVSPENKTYPVADIPLTFTVDERTSWMGYSLDSQANVSIAGNTTLTGLSDGTHSLTVYVKDLFGNIGSSETVTFTVDTTHPLISILSPENKTYATNTIPLNFTVTRTTSWIAYSLDSKANVTITGNITLTGLSNGLHNLTVYAKDTDGNTGVSETVYFTIKTEQSASFPTIEVAAAAVAITVMIAIAALILKKKRK
jgi:parallel beta-helix repeat protein